MAQSRKITELEKSHPTDGFNFLVATIDQNYRVTFPDLAYSITGSLQETLDLTKGLNDTSDLYVQFNRDGSLSGDSHFIYDYDHHVVSGASGYYQDLDGISGHLTDELIVGELENDTFVTMADGEVDINGNVSVDGNLTNSLVPKYGLDITLGSPPSKRGSSGFSASRVSAGHYRVNFQFPAYADLESYQVVASISNIPSSSWGTVAGDPRANIEIVRQLNRIDLHISSEAGTLIDSGIVTILIYEL